MFSSLRFKGTLSHIHAQGPRSKFSSGGGEGGKRGLKKNA